MDSDGLLLTIFGINIQLCFFNAVSFSVLLLELWGFVVPLLMVKTPSTASGLSYGDQASKPDACSH